MSHSTPMNSVDPHPKLLRLREALEAGERPNRVDLSGCGLTELPEEVFNLSDTLEFLNLGSNNLTTLPDKMRELKKLRILFFEKNHFDKIPEVIGSLQSLYMLSFKSNRLEHISETCLPHSVGWLILTDNRLKKLPSCLGNMPLRKVMLAGNQLEELPQSMANCNSLELIRLASNKLLELPPWLRTLPSLAWVGFNGNPFSSLPSTFSSSSSSPSSSSSSSSISSSCSVMPTFSSPSSGCSADPPTSFSSSESIMSIPWSELQIQDKLGEGASGVVFRALWRRQVRNGTGIGEEQIAVKLFKGHATSDGNPKDEMEVSMAAGNHPNAVRVRGRIYGHPEGVDGLVLDLIHPDFKILGNPPSFDTVTRDTYPAGKKMNISRLLTIVKGVAAVCAHLHSNCISHGDLYAHNILVRETDGMPLLSDFGAASFYKPDHPNKKKMGSRLTLPTTHEADEGVLLAPSLPSSSDTTISMYQSPHSESLGIATPLQAEEAWEVKAFGHLLEELLGMVDEPPENANSSTSDGKDNEVIKVDFKREERYADIRRSLEGLRARCLSTDMTKRPSFQELESSTKSL